jgi:manganese/zinc/iron transport system permease protein
MTTAQIEIQLIAAVVAVACALPGTFLVLRRMALLSDAISHAILLGIVLAFFATGDLSSPWLLLAASFTGVLTVALVEVLQKTGRLQEDAAIGLVFPALFSIGVLLVARYASNVHIDVDSVLLGELAFAPFHRFTLAGVDMGPHSFFVMGAILLVNIVFIVLFFKELKLATFDAGLAATLGFSPIVLHYSLMSLVSVTAVGAFDAVGSILVVALMVGPPATAWLLTDNLAVMLVLSALIGIASAISGYWLAHSLDASIAGSMATMGGVLFVLTFLFAPQRGIIAIALRRRGLRWEFAISTLLVHLLHHEGLPEADEECAINHLLEHFHWPKKFADQVTSKALSKQWIRHHEGCLHLTDIGRKAARTKLLK